MGDASGRASDRNETPHARATQHSTHSTEQLVVPLEAENCDRPLDRHSQVCVRVYVCVSSKASESKEWGGGLVGEAKRERREGRRQRRRPTTTKDTDRAALVRKNAIRSKECSERRS